MNVHDIYDFQPLFSAINPPTHQNPKKKKAPSLFLHQSNPPMRIPKRYGFPPPVFLLSLLPSQIDLLSVLPQTTKTNMVMGRPRS